MAADEKPEFLTEMGVRVVCAASYQRSSARTDFPNPTSLCTKMLRFDVYDYTPGLNIFRQLIRDLMANPLLASETFGIQADNASKFGDAD